MEEKILNILLDMQIDMKDLKTRVINIEEKELPGIKESIKDIQEKELPGIKESIKDIQEKELPKIKESIKYIQEKELPSINNSIRIIRKTEIPGLKKSIKNLAYMVNNIEKNELPEIRQQRLVDSNNIAKILNLQTELNSKMRQYFQEIPPLKIYK